MIKEAIAKVVTGTSLSEAEAEAVMREIMQGEATDAQISAYITALRIKGETVEEITGSARVIREKAGHIKLDAPFQVDTCGTGGDNGIIEPQGGDGQYGDAALVYQKGILVGAVR